MAIDQYGNEWTLEYKGGAIWAIGKDDEGKKCARLVVDRQIVVDWSKPKAVRRLALTDAAMTVNLAGEASKALDRINARKGEDIDQWAERLGNDLGKFTD